MRRFTPIISPRIDSTRPDVTPLHKWEEGENNLNLPSPFFTFTQEGGFHAFADSKKQGFHHNPAAIQLDRFDVATKIKEKC